MTYPRVICSWTLFTYRISGFWTFVIVLLLVCFFVSDVKPYCNVSTLVGLGRYTYDDDDFDDPGLTDAQMQFVDAFHISLLWST